MTCKFDKLVVSTECSPLVFNNALDSWPARTWSPDSLSCVLGNKMFDCRISPRTTQEVLWEGDCMNMSATLSQVSAWMKGKSSEDNPLHSLLPMQFSCYVDYKYMKDMFADHVEELKSVRWETFGLDGRDGVDSTIWIGSAGASTPCHYDTYGFNLVAQIYGRKRWHLFPPSDSACLYPTRIPYEESSVFSEVYVKQPDLLKHPRFKHCSPVVINLEPGQVLFVPRHWWHYVECLEPAISINTWVEMPEDDVSRYHEALTRLMFSGFASTIGDTSEEWLNPTEEIMPMEVNLCYLETSLQNVLQPQKDDTVAESCTENVPSNNLYKLAATFHDYSVKCLHTECSQCNSKTNTSLTKSDNDENTCTSERVSHVASIADENTTKTNLTKSDSDENTCTSERVCHEASIVDENSRKNQDGDMFEKRKNQEICPDEIMPVKHRKLPDGVVCSSSDSVDFVVKGDSLLQGYPRQIKLTNNAEFIRKKSKCLKTTDIEIFALYPCSCCDRYASSHQTCSTGINTAEAGFTNNTNLHFDESPQTPQQSEDKHSDCKDLKITKETLDMNSERFNPHQTSILESKMLTGLSKKDCDSYPYKVFHSDMSCLNEENTSTDKMSDSVLKQDGITCKLLDGKTIEQTADSREQKYETLVLNEKPKFRDLVVKCMLHPRVVNVLADILKENYQ